MDTCPTERKIRKRGGSTIYQGENQTALESQKLISDAFLEILQEKPYAKINVKEICERASVSRQTFYSLFKTKENVIAYLLQCTCSHPKEAACVKQKISVGVIAESYAGFIYTNFEFLQLLMEHDLGDLLQQYFYESVQCCDKWAEVKAVDVEVLQKFFVGAMAGIISSVVTDPQKKDIKYLKNTIEYLLSGEYLC